MRQLSYLWGFTLFAAGVFAGSAIQPAGAQQPTDGSVRLNHVGIAVKDFQESLNFYTKVLGFKVAYALPSPDGKPTTTFLQISRDTFIEMAPANDKLRPGLTHIGLLTDDAKVRSGGGTGSRLSNVLDPNDIRLELVEQPS